MKRRKQVRLANSARRRSLKTHALRDYIVKNARRATLREVNALAHARVLASTQETQDPVLREVLFCSPVRDQDATTTAVRRQQAKLHKLRGATLTKAALCWLHVRAWRAFCTERFVDQLGVNNFRTLSQYYNTCVTAALAVWSSGFHAFTNAYGRNGVVVEWFTERRHWNLRDESTAKRLQREYLHQYWWPRAEAAWKKLPAVEEALGAQDWRLLNKAARCLGAGPFSALQLAKDFLDAPGWSNLSSESMAQLEEWYPVASCPGTARGLRWLYGASLCDDQLLTKLRETRDKLNFDLRECRLPLPAWTLGSTAHWLCELDKYLRARTGAGKPPRLRSRNKEQGRLGGSGGDTRDCHLAEL